MAESPTILVAEDDAGVRDIVRTRLDAAGYQTHTVRNGEEAMRQILTLRPQALVLDINMPKMDGFAVLEALRARRNQTPLPVLILTARHAAEDVRHALTLGAKDYLTKPFNEAQLLARVARLLRRPIPAPAVPHLL